MKKTEVKANAKINLFLEITGRRENGYHDISTVMHEISLHDTVTVKRTEKDCITITSDSKAMPTDKRNIAYKCAEAFFEQLGSSFGINIHIEKRIPMEAGLAGGSADGAAVLKGLNELCSFPFTEEKLCEIGKSIGADIPFCVMGGAMLCEGIGEIMTPCQTLPECVILIAKGSAGVSTKQAYANLDAMTDRIIRDNNMPDLLKNGDIHSICSSMYNCFEPLVPSVEAIKDIMKKAGALNAKMSGSGSAVFGIFTDSSKAQNALKELKEKGYFAAIC